jgi:predicted ATPase/class 3 adenylate cyclase
VSLTTRTTALLLTDVVGSTALWQAHPEQMSAAMARHHDIVAKTVAAHGGRLPQDQGEGDARFAAFESAIAAVAAAVDIQRALAAEAWPEPVRLSVRMGIHAGEVLERDGNLFGDPVNRCARIRGLAHGGQVLLSGTTKELVEGWPPEGVGMLDLGEHRMKDLTAPVRIYQVTHPDLPAEFPPLASLNRARHNLPVQLSSFVGRAAALAELVALVRAHPLVTVTGFGGMGKTRLALQAGAELADGDGDGVWFVDLSAVRDPAGLPEAVARVLGLSGEGDPLDQVRAHLADKRILLLCDNVEQLLPDAASLLAAVAGAGPGVRVLVTSREPVGLRGEQVYPLPPLASPAPSAALETVESLGTYDAAALFIARATAADPRFTVDNSTAPALAAVCARLDGWPLALELAAARVRLLGLPGLLDRLNDRLAVLTSTSRDVPDRQRTLRETIAWSYDLLSPDEQALLARLSVFTGGATLDAIVAVCQPGLGADVLEALGSLLDKSLLHQDERDGRLRHRLLETVREFAGERLEAGGEAAQLRTRHGYYFRDLFSSGEAGPGPGEGFEDEVANIHAAIVHLADEDPEAASGLLIETYVRMMDVGAFHSGEALNALIRQRDLAPGTRAALDVNRAFHQYLTGRRDAAYDVLRDAVPVLISSRENQLMASRGANLIAGILAERGESDEARRWSEEGIAVSEWAPAPWVAHEALQIAGYVARLGGDSERAVELSRRGLEVMPPDAPPYRRSNALGELCRCLVAAQRTEEALRVGGEAVDVARPVGGLTLAFAQGCRSQALLAAGRTEEAARGFVAATQATRDVGVVPYELGWTALSLLPLFPEVGAAVLGATDALFAANGDPDVYPPEDLLAPARTAYETGYAEQLARGRDLGWPEVVTLLDDLDLG